MGQFLERLQQPDACHLIERSPEGFAIVRRSTEQAQAFNDLAREAMRHSGVDYVALPRTDGMLGYDSVFIIPTD